MALVDPNWYLYKFSAKSPPVYEEIEWDAHDGHGELAELEEELFDDADGEVT